MQCEASMGLEQGTEYLKRMGEQAEKEVVTSTTAKHLPVSALLVTLRLEKHRPEEMPSVERGGDAETSYSRLARSR
jgi:hypothetical protein